MRTRLALVVVLVVGFGITRATVAVPGPTGGDAVRANVLWEPPGTIQDRDLYNGQWGARLKPDPSAVYTFVRRKERGTNPGVVVKDGQGREWHVKQAPRGSVHPEGPVEVALSRVISALGYYQPPVYYLPSFVMRDADGKGTHTEVGGRFRLHEPELKQTGNWSWDDPLVKGSRPYNGLLVMLLAFSSWDFKESNNCIYQVQRNGRTETWYVVRDLGGALGSEGRLRATRNDIGKFEQQGFIRGISDGYVEFEYGGKRGDLYRQRIDTADVRWAVGLLASLDERQWRDAFRAGGYSPQLSERFILKIKANIAEGQRLAANPRAMAGARW